MEYKELVPRLPLARFISKLWIVTYPSEHKQEQILPLPFHHFIINLSNEPYRVVRCGKEQVNWSFAEGFISGLQEQYLVIENPALIRNIGVELKPYGLLAFVDQPIDWFIGKVQDSEASLPGSSLLAARLRTLKDSGECLNSLLDFMNTHFKPDFKLPLYIEQSARLLEEGYAVTEIAQEVGISHKHLINQWRTYCGITPKHYQDIVRLQKVLAWFEEAHKPIRWSDASSHFSYFDQPHFIRTFRKFSGFSPREYARLLETFSSGTQAFVALDDAYIRTG